jgi:hypothetical protein
MEVDEEEDEEPQSQKPKKIRPKTYTHLSRVQEESMVEWIQSHEVLYNKKLENYKDVKKKGFLWQQQAHLVGSR